MTKIRRKKLNLNVKREFQLWLLVRILGIVIISSVVAAAILYFYGRAETVDSFYSAHIKIRRLSELLFPVVMAGASVSLVGGILLSLFLPQKIAGPIYHIEKVLQEVREGNLMITIRLREKDTLQEFAENLSEVLSELGETIHKVKKEQENAEKALWQHDLKAVREHLSRERELLEHFRTRQRNDHSMIHLPRQGDG